MNASIKSINYVVEINFSFVIDLNLSNKLSDIKLLKKFSTFKEILNFSDLTRLLSETNSEQEEEKIK